MDNNMESQNMDNNTESPLPDIEQIEASIDRESSSRRAEEGFWHTIASFAWLRWQDASQSFSESCCGKIKAICMLITLPCYTVVCPVLLRRPYYKLSHASIIYLYILLACTIVFNLWEQQVRETTDSVSSITYQLMQYFEIICMFVAVLFLAYINYSTHGRVIYYDSRESNQILYFRTGLYVFGVSSLLYTMLNLVNYSGCGNAQHILLNTVKFLYISAQILFLNRFYQAKLPNDRELQIALAHVLGTNLSLWIWTLCKEVYEPRPKDDKCKSQPIHLGSSEKYFYPLFIEYLLLVASMMYELWANVQMSDAGANHGDSHTSYTYCQSLIRAMESVEQLPGPSSNQPTTERRRPQRRRNFVPSLATSLILGLMFAIVFIAFVLAANDSTKKAYFEKYLIVNICLYCSQILVCYVVLVSRHSERRNERRNSVNLDDALLYFGLAGIILWEGFHAYALCFTEKPSNIEFANSVIGMLEDIIQTVTLISASRYCSRKDNNAKKIANCAHFLLATNFALWCQNSFYIEHDILNPGEHHESIERRLRVFGNILNPIIIFFRFHSATCCYNLWYIFHSDD